MSTVTTAELKSEADVTNMERGKRDERERSERDPGKRLIKQLDDCVRVSVGCQELTRSGPFSRNL